MAIFFMGGEDIDFSPLGTVSVNTGSSTFRSDFARCALAVTGGSPLANGWGAKFSAPTSAFWAGMRIAASTSGLSADPGQGLVVFGDAQQARLGLTITTGMTLALVTWDASGNMTKLVSSAVGAVPTSLFKLDVYVAYGTTGQVRVFVNQIEVITFNGDVTAAGSTTLGGMRLCSPSSDNSQTYYSEVFVTDHDSRTLMLKTHVPTADAQGNQWTGNFQQVSETTADESSVISTSTNDQVSSFSVNGLPSGSNLAIRGFKVSGYAARGETGPQHLDLGVVTNGQTAFGPDQNVDTGWTRVSQTFETNPVTNSAWVSADINAINISVKSRA